MDEALRVCYRTLEIEPGAPLSEVHIAYKQMKELYEGGSSLALSSLSAGEDSPERRTRILADVEEAYRRILASVEQKEAEARSDMKAAADELQAEIAKVERFTGPVLMSIRKRLGVELYEMELSTKVRALHLDSMEKQLYDKLPAEVFLRGYIKLYAKYLSLDPERVLADYMEGYRQWQRKKEPKKP